MRTILLFCLVAITLCFSRVSAQDVKGTKLEKPLVNQPGYNLGEAKRFVCFGAKNDTEFNIINTRTSETVYKGRIINFEGWFNDFNPITSTDEYVVDVKDRGQSVPFWVADHLIEKVSSKLAYDFFVDVRGYADLNKYEISKVYSGGPSRDSGPFGLETVFQTLFYASNPALFDNWKNELGNGKVPDLIALTLWHAEFSYKYHNYNGPVLNRHGTLGYEGEPRMNFDYWNTLDQLAAVCAGYHTFLKPYMSEETYQKYRKVCNDKWEEYDRHKTVRYWTHSNKWVDKGFQEFNEMGNAFGQSVFSNLFMYLTEKNEKDGQPEKYMRYAQESAKDIILNWDFNNPRHTWWIRNAEHITPQALIFFQMLAPEHAPKGTVEKLAQWSSHIKQKTNNYWKYRIHYENEWAHPSSKELGGAPALGGSMFGVAHLLNDKQLRNIGWAQVDFTFGVNPVGAHFSNKSKERVDIGAFWEGVEVGWPESHPNGYGRLGLVRGTLDGSPLDKDFPRENSALKKVEEHSDVGIAKNAYSTEGWSISNRGWMTTLTFSTLGSHRVRIFDEKYENLIANAKKGQTITIELKDALNIDWNKADKGWVEIAFANADPVKVEIVETGINTGIFTTKYSIPTKKVKSPLTVSYGYWGFEKAAVIFLL
jgi:hypothetical protein